MLACILYFFIFYIYCLDAKLVDELVRLASEQPGNAEP